MNPNLIDLPNLLLTAVMCSLRAIVSFQLLPMFASSQVPATVRVGIAMSIVLPVVMARQDMPLPTQLDAWSLVLLVVREGGIGLVIGLGFGALCAGLQTAGDIIDHQNGLTFTQNIDPIFGNTISITAHLFERVLFSAMMSAGLMLIVVDALYLSYELWPVGQSLPAFEKVVPITLIDQSGRLFSLALLLAGPVLLVLFIVDISMGMLNRAAPQLNVFNITLSMKPIVGLAVLAFAMPMIVEYSLRALIEFAQFMRQLIAMKV